MAKPEAEVCRVIFFFESDIFGNSWRNEAYLAYMGTNTRSLRYFLRTRKYRYCSQHIQLNYNHFQPEIRIANHTELELQILNSCRQGNSNSCPTFWVSINSVGPKRILWDVEVAVKSKITGITRITYAMPWIWVFVEEINEIPTAIPIFYEV